MNEVTASTVDELRKAYSNAWNEFEQAVTSAGMIWNERVLEPEGDGGAGDSPGAGEAWSARIAAWHAISAERIRCSLIDHLLTDSSSKPVDVLTYAASESAGDVSISSLREQFRDTKTPDDMLSVMQQARAATSDLLSRIRPEDLGVAAHQGEFEQDYLRQHGQTPSPDIRGVLLHGFVHLTDHARQISRAASTD